VTLELGGKSPTIVHKDADISLAARRIMWGKVVNSGQSCIAPDYVFVHRNVKSAFLTACKEVISSFYGTNPKLSADYGRIVNTHHSARLKRLLDVHSGDIYTGGACDVNDRYVAPTILFNIQTSAEIMKEEIFGPILPVLEYDEIGSVISYINSQPKPLALYLFTSSDTVIKSVTTYVSSGGVSINDVMMHFVNGAMPFGGVGSSGMGNYHGWHGFVAFSHAKSILHKSRWLDAPMRYPPYTNLNYRLFRYAAEIYRINSDSFHQLFAAVFFPIISLAVARSAGLTLNFRSNL